MNSTQDDQYQQLAHYVGHWSWMFVLYKYDASHTLIADREFIDKLQASRKTKLECKVAEPGTYESAITDETRKVLVFCREGEIALIRKIKKQYPEVLVSSGTYGYACVGKDRYPRLYEFKPPAAKKPLKTAFIISTPYADAEFISNVLAENGLPYAHEYLARPFIPWLGLHKNFQISRFYATTEQHHARGGALYSLLQTDVLNSLFANSQYSLRRFISYLQRSSAKVILVTRKNTMAQATIGQLLNRTLERSVWTKSASKKMPARFEMSDFIGCYKRYQQILADQSMLEEIAASVDAHKVCLEDFVEDQATGTQAIATYLSHDLPDTHTVSTIDYSEGYAATPNFYPSAKVFQQELIDRLGLHIDAFCPRSIRG